MHRRSVRHFLFLDAHIKFTERKSGYKTHIVSSEVVKHILQERSTKVDNYACNGKKKQMKGTGFSSLLSRPMRGSPGMNGCAKHRSDYGKGYWEM